MKREWDMNYERGSLLFIEKLGKTGSFRFRRKFRFRSPFGPGNHFYRPKWRGNCEYSIFRLRNGTELRNAVPTKSSESISIYHSKRPQRNEDRRTGPVIFFGGPELPKNPKNQKLNRTEPRAVAARHGAHTRRFGARARWNTCSPGFQSDFHYK